MLLADAALSLYSPEEAHYLLQTRVVIPEEIKERMEGLKSKIVEEKQLRIEMEDLLISKFALHKRLLSKIVENCTAPEE